VDDVDRAGGALDGGAAPAVPGLVQGGAGQRQVADGDGRPPGFRRRPAMARRHAHLLDPSRRRHRRHLVDDRAGGAARHPVPALFDDDGDTHGR
jgi:hypothetical protein